MMNLVQVLDNGNVKDFISINGVLLGTSYREIDGFYVFVPEDRHGFWGEHALRMIADRLKELNADWERQLEKDLI